MLGPHTAAWAAADFLGYCAAGDFLGLIFARIES
jgi:hypothetical protein